MDAKTARSALKKCMKSKSADDDDEDDDEAMTMMKKANPSRRRLASGSRSNSACTWSNSARNPLSELNRQSSINAIVARYQVNQIEVEQDGKKVKVDLAAHAIQEGWSAELAELHALRAARPGAGVGVPGGLAYSTSNPELNDAVLECAVFQARPTSVPPRRRQILFRRNDRQRQHGQDPSSAREPSERGSSRA